MLLRELAKLSSEKKDDVISAIVSKANSKPNGQLDSARLEIQGFETKHGMTTSEMRARFQSGEVAEDYEIVRWLMLARMVRG